jgi:hypothetical protein
VFAPTATEVKLVPIIGHGAGNSHYALRAWLNGTAMPVMPDPKHSPEQLEQRLDPMTSYQLKAGWNEVLLRYDHIWGDTFVGVRIEAPAETLWKLKISNAKPSAKQP